MRWQLLPVVLAASVVSAVGAARADGYEPPRAPAPFRLQVSNWTGFYGNAGVGYGLWEADTTTVSPATGACIVCANQNQGGKGWLGEIGLGYDYQFSDKIVGGVFANYDFSSISGRLPIQLDSLRLDRQQFHLVRWRPRGLADDARLSSIIGASATPTRTSMALP